MIERSISVRTRGRYLVIPSQSAEPAPVLVGFHGYAERAETQLERLREIPGSERWTLVSMQGLHRFYQRRMEQVVASWTTRQDRELAVADNLDYVAGTLDAIAAEFSTRPPIVFAGFSQGVAMAFRAAVASPIQQAAVIAVGNDIPPEIDSADLARLPRVMLCRASHDEWYSAGKFTADSQRLENAGISFKAFEYPGGHEWSGDVTSPAAGFLAEYLATPSK